MSHATGYNTHTTFLLFSTPLSSYLDFKTTQEDPKDTRIPHFFSLCHLEGGGHAWVEDERSELFLLG